VFSTWIVPFDTGTGAATTVTLVDAEATLLTVHVTVWEPSDVALSVVNFAVVGPVGVAPCQSTVNDDGSGTWMVQVQLVDSPPWAIVLGLQEIPAFVRTTVMETLLIPGTRVTVVLPEAV
jgi:hypothetical protein